MHSAGKFISSYVARLRQRPAGGVICFNCSADFLDLQPTNQTNNEKIHH
jgi:hypothetical protein